MFLATQIFFAAITKLKTARLPQTIADDIDTILPSRVPGMFKQPITKQNIAAIKKPILTSFCGL